MLKSAEPNKIFPLRKMVPGVLFQGHSNTDSLSFFLFSINKTQLNQKKSLSGCIVTELVIYHLKLHQLVISVCL